MAFPAGWSRKCAITIDNTKVAGSGTLTSFPVCLTAANLPSEMLDKDGSYPAQMGGGDIRFTADAAGTQPLPCHVLDFVTADNPANGTAQIYVAASVAGTSDTTIYVWYAADSHKEQPKYDANTDADGFQGSDYVWANYQSIYALGGFGGLRNLKQANSSKNLGRYGATLQPKTYVVASRASGNDYISFPSLVKIGERLYCCAREAPQHEVDIAGSVGVYSSDDMGKTWAAVAGLTVTDATKDLRDPKLFAQSDGTLWVFYSKTNSGDTSRVVAYRKASAPYSAWGSETELTTLTKANSSGKVIELASGRVMVPLYDIDGSGNSAPFVRWTDDDGASWTTDYLTSDGAAPGTYGAYNEFSIAEDPGAAGNLVAIVRRNGFTNLYRQTSTDSGQTWSAAASNIAIDAGATPDMPEIQYCHDGDLLLAYSKDRNAPEYRVTRSTDHGATWASDYAILWDNNNGTSGEPDSYTGMGGYMSFVEMAKGLFCAVFYHDNGNFGPSRVYATHFSKVEDGALNFWTDTSKQIAGHIAKGVELDDTNQWIGNASLSFFNNVHNAGAFTISGWAKFNQTSDELHCFAGSSASAQDRGFFFGYENRAAAGAPNALRLFAANGSGTSVNNQSASISGDTAVHRYGVMCSAAGTPTFIKDATTYAGSAALTTYAGDAELSTRIGGVANSTADLVAGRLDGWMEMWGFSTANLGVDYETTRYNNESAPAAFAAAGTPQTTTGSADLVVSDSAHGHAADGLTLTSGSVLAINDAAHAHVADSLTLSADLSLVVSDAAHNHAADTLSVSADHSLAVADALHGHAADGLTLDSGATLSVAEASHAHAADSLDLGSAHTLVTADATHGLTSTAAVLSAAHALLVADASHAHAADNMDLVSGIALSISEAAHAHVADGLSLSQALTLAIQDALHAHDGAVVTLSAAIALAINDALHAHGADSVAIYLPSDVGDLLIRSVFTRVDTPNQFVRLDTPGVFTRV